MLHLSAINDDFSDKNRDIAHDNIKKMKFWLYVTFSLIIFLLVIILISVSMSIYDKKEDKQMEMMCAILEKVCSMGQMETVQASNGLEGVIFRDGENSDCMELYNSECL